MDPFRDRSEQPKLPHSDDPPGGSQSSATGIFGTIPATPPREEEDLLASLGRKPEPPPAATPAPSAAPTPATTQPAPALAPAPAPQQGEFTRMLQALKTPESESARPVSRPSEELARYRWRRSRRRGRRRLHFPRFRRKSLPPLHPLRRPRRQPANRAALRRCSRR